VNGAQIWVTEQQVLHVQCKVSVEYLVELVDQLTSGVCCVLRGVLCCGQQTGAVCDWHRALHWQMVLRAFLAFEIVCRVARQ
jgi:hypothetical protein